MIHENINQSTSENTETDEKFKEINKSFSKERVVVWKELLDYKNFKDFNQLSSLILDLPEQSLIRSDCKRFSESLNLPDNNQSEVSQDIEGIVTCYCKSRGLIYTSDLGLVQTASVFVSLECPMTDIYALFENFRGKFIFNNQFNNHVVFQLFRVLLTYHDPYILSFLDTKRVTPDIYTSEWLQTLFSSSCSQEVIVKLWDLYFMEDDIFLIFFLMMILILNSRDFLLEKALLKNEYLINYIKMLPQHIGVNDSEDMINLAKFYRNKTPKSFYKQCQAHILGNIILTGIPLPVLCLEILPTELVASYSLNDSLKFFTVDCRPSNEYEFGHLPQSFNLKASLIYHNREDFNKCLQDLFQFHQSLLDQNSLSCEHICFLNSSDNEEDKMLLNMVISSFLQRRISYVSIIRGGYSTLHELLVNGDSSYDLINHNPLKCTLCLLNNSSISSDKISSKKSIDKSSHEQKSISSKFFDSLKITKQKIEDTLALKNKSQSKHISSQDKANKKRYIGPKGVFRIDDQFEDENSFDTFTNNIDLSQIVTDQDKNIIDDKNSDISSLSSNSSIKSNTSRNDLVKASLIKADKNTVAFYVCTELIQVTGELMPSFMVLRCNELIVLRQINNNLQWAKIVSNISLNQISRITCNRSNTHLISFHIENTEQNIFTKRLFHFSDGKSVVRQITAVIESL